MMAVQQGTGAEDLCREGDKLLGKEELHRATALYTSAFKSQAGFTVSHMRGLEKPRLAGVISTLEAWLDDQRDHKLDRLQEGLNKGLAAVFLSTLSPNNLSASLFKMETVLLSAGQGFEEVAARCSVLLEGKNNPMQDGSKRLALEVTRALACLLSEPHSPRGLQLYLKAYQEKQLETVELVKCRQAQHLPKIVKAFLEQLLSHNTTMRHTESEFAEGTSAGARLEPAVASECLDFLAAVCPGEKQLQELRAVTFFHNCRFEESAKAYSLALQESFSKTEYNAVSDKAAHQKMGPERKSALLVARAAALFSAGGRATEACRDLGEAFRIHPAASRQGFQRLFSDRGIGAAARTQLRQQAERGLSQYKETVLMRSDLRSSEGAEQLDPVIAGLQALCHLEPNGGGRELRVRLADCLLLRGEFREALSICNQLVGASPSQQSYQNTVQVLRGYARLLSDDHEGSLEDFQAVIKHDAPHPSSCVRALCGRGLLRMMGGSHYLTALDYITASRLQPQDTALTVRVLIPWNYRGLLCTVLQEQGRAMLEGAGGQNPLSSPLVLQKSYQRDHTQSTQTREGYFSNKERTPLGVHALAILSMELEPGAEGPYILAADALYCMGRIEEAYRLLLSTGHALGRPPILARLALLQLHRGFLYDADQLLKKLTQCGDTSCLRPLLAIAAQEDRALLQRHCHAAAMRMLEGQREESGIRKVVAYLSIAIIASGGEATDSLLERARCYALLGQCKTAIFDFTAILKENKEHVQALCGRGFTYLTLNQQNESICDVLAALQVDSDAVTRDILSLKENPQRLICDWLQQYCRTNLAEIIASNPVPCGEEHLRDAFLIGGALMKTYSREPRWHLLYIDTLIVKGEMKAACSHLIQIFGQDPREAEAQARLGVIEAWQQNFRCAVKWLSRITEKDPSVLDFSLALINTAHRKPLAQVAAEEAGCLSERGQWEHALALLTVAVQVAEEGQPQYLRQRSACLARLGIHKRAVSDLDRVIHSHAKDGDKDPKLLVEDLCRRGCSLVLCSREEPGLEDFARALYLHKAQALHCIEGGLGRPRLVECFLQGALQQFEKQQVRQAWRLTESGMRVDSSHTELRRLRARIKSEFSGSCIVH